MEFEVVNIALYLAIILFATKLCGLITRRLGISQIVGMVIAGLLIGPAIFSHLGIPGFSGIINPSEIEMDVLDAFSQVGVILILFSSGIETDIKELKKSGLASTIIACVGVAVPIALGACAAILFMGGFGEFANAAKLHNALYVGCILAATSVGITVETLRELGKLNTKIGTVILSAAIIDDVIGIVALSLITSFKEGNVWITLLKCVGFFVFTIGAGFLLRKLFIAIGKRHPHTRRIGIFALAMCFLFAYCAEKFFGVAAITGAYMAGLMLSGLNDAGFVDRKVIVSGYMIFTPIFFAYIGISANFSNFGTGEILFAVVLIIVGIVSKIIGCGGAAKLCGYNGRESLTIGCGMVARGEVSLAVYSSGYALVYFGANGELLGIDPLLGTILLIIVSSIVCPILLKLCFKNKRPQEPIPASGPAPERLESAPEQIQVGSGGKTDD